MKLYLGTLIKDASCPRDITNLTEKEMEMWEEESGKAVYYYELFTDEECNCRYDYGCIHYDDLPLEVLTSWHNDKALEQFIINNYEYDEVIVAR